MFHPWFLTVGRFLSPVFQASTLWIGLPVNDSLKHWSKERKLYPQASNSDIRNVTSADDNKRLTHRCPAISEFLLCSESFNQPSAANPSEYL
ncbi:hypothetical protein BDP27DRAFT_1331024 [Rhodocollybia butyracea]|uniref:Secreted protein n=1 Tax=Rhodocollybia butyracea TaxID=206335 RepID=A0A9P5PEN0_9AGAR|nr:hypothetical protein BDP27DRAFT_1336665 [Rhodocollybia butyracea]KAF9066142.1 hypothetical protein BDP27DRAFT_1331024 [Rhodocollybia butyracea]